YFDEIYDFIFTKNVFRLGRWFWKGGDTYIIDGFGPDGIAATVVRAARRLGAVQSGLLYHYAFAMIIGVVALVSWYVLGGGAH
ncbi:MAG: NADH-quinone oxidoreductase subunit L, partial [Rhodobacteraceae bacterium]|nr:NADH-quinone oxidoreductase subunit L [Paracoccaceae bacterium]